MSDKNENAIGDFSFGVEEQVELVTKFFDDFGHDNLNLQQSMALDLYRAIQCYRLYDNVEVFLETNPELNVCQEDIVDLWKEFDEMDAKDLAEISIKLLEDL